MKKHLLTFSAVLMSASLQASAISIKDSVSYAVECKDPSASSSDPSKLARTLFTNVSSMLYYHQGMQVLLPAPGTYSSLPQEGSEQKTLVVGHSSKAEGTDLAATDFEMSVSDEETTANFKLDYLYEVRFGRNSTSIKSSGRLKITADTQNAADEQGNVHCEFTAI